MTSHNALIFGFVWGGILTFLWSAADYNPVGFAALFGLFVAMSTPKVGEWLLRAVH